MPLLRTRFLFFNDYGVINIDTYFVNPLKKTMKHKYYIDTEKFTLNKFKNSLQERRMIPSRVILKEDLDARFEILNSSGIDNLKALIDALKTKDKIEAFSSKSGLSIEYLTILKREASSYLPNPVNLNKFPGIDSKAIEALEKIGIKNTKQFYNKVNIGQDVNLISEKANVPMNVICELASLSDLARLYGVGPVFARIIYDVGIKSVESFISYSAKEFVEFYENSTKKKADFSESDINFSLDLARELIDNTKE